MGPCCRLSPARLGGYCSTPYIKMADAVVGTWEIAGSEGLEPMLKSLGMDDEHVARMTGTTHTVEYKKEGDSWHVITSVPGRGVIRDMTLKIGEPYDSMTITRDPCKSVVTQEGEKMVEKQTGGPVDFTIVREMEGEQMKVTLTGKGQTAVMRYKRAS